MSRIIVVVVVQFTNMKVMSTYSESGSACEYVMNRSILEKTGGLGPEI